MTRDVYTTKLNELHADLEKMGQLVDRSIETVIHAFLNNDVTLAKEVMKNDAFINDMQRTIESLAISLMLQQQPVASDLRNITSIIKIVTDLERIGDQAADMAEIMLEFKTTRLFKTIEHIPTMAEKARIMVYDAIDAFISNNLEKGKKVISMDDEIDALFLEVKKEVANILKEGNEKIDDCIDFLMIAKYLERIGDHAVNICEWLEFNQTGVLNHTRLI